MTRPRGRPGLHLCLSYDLREVRRSIDETVDILGEAVATLVGRWDAELTVSYEPVGVADRLEMAFPSLPAALERVRTDGWGRAVVAPGGANPSWQLTLDLAFREFRRSYPLLHLAQSRAEDPLERWEALSRCAAETQALEGHLVYDHHPTPYTESWAWGSVRDLDARVPGYPWGLIVSDHHLERLGGIDVWLKDAPVASAERISAPPNRLMARARLTETPKDLPEERLRAWKDFLQPIMMPRQPHDAAGSPFLGLLPEDQPRPR